MPPCGDDQQDTVTDVVIVLGAWVRKHRELVLGTNEAGMRLGGATRDADAAVWHRAEALPRTGGLRRTPPVLAVEVAGQDESELDLRGKAAWYLGVGVPVVWFVLPATREVVVMAAGEERRLQVGGAVPARPELPDLEPQVASLFEQLSEP